MQHLIHAIQSRLKQRKLYHQAIGLVVKEFLKPHTVDPSALQVKVFWQTCTLCLSTKEDKTRWFLQKAALLEEINKKLADDGREVQFAEVRVK